MAKSNDGAVQYEALTLRNEVGIGKVNIGDVVDLEGAGWPAKAIADVVFRGFYAPLGELPDAVQQELVKLSP